MGKAFFDYFLSYGLVGGHEAFDEGDGTGELCGVAFNDALDQLGGRGEGFALGPSHVWVYRWGLSHSGVDGEAGVLGVVFGVFHGVEMLNLQRYGFGAGVKR